MANSSIAPGPLRETDEPAATQLLCELNQGMVQVARMTISVWWKSLWLSAYANQEWLDSPELQSRAMNDKALIDWPADEKGQKRIPTALGIKLNVVLQL